MPVNTTNMALPKPVGGDDAGIALKTSVANAFDIIDPHRHTGGADGLQVGLTSAPSGATYPNAIFTGRRQGAQGANVVAANNLTLGADGNAFTITGATQINLVSGTGWAAGSEVTFLFASNPLVKAAIAVSGAFLTIELSGNVDFATAAGSTLTLILMDGFWREKGRKA